MHMPDYLSEELFHFVGNGHPDDHETNFETLLKILRSGCISCNPPEIGWGKTTLTLERGQSLLNETLVRGQITCYCDIPRDLLGRHTAKYGSFGVGLHRLQLARYGARPVLYVPMTSTDHLGIYGATLLRDIEAKFEAFMEHLYEENRTDGYTRNMTSIPSNSSDTIRAMRGLLEKDFLAFIKPYNAGLEPDDINYFYSEREWRRLGGFMFKLHDITSIVVKSGYKVKLHDAIPDYRGVVVEI